MRIQQFIKTLNNTELGKGTTHEYYVLVPSSFNIENIFDSSNLNPVFYDKTTLDVKTNTAQLSKGREMRIKGLGTYYRDNNACAGDEIIFERRDDGEGTLFFISLKSKPNNISFQKNSKGFEVLNIDRLSPYLSDGIFKQNVLYQSRDVELLIEFKLSGKKRNDSPILTDFYDIKVDNVSLLSKFKNNEYIQLDNDAEIGILKKTIVWQSFEFNF